ncbi:hypothetical protein EBR66_00155 [bacterium]|nr:hypothetical protein [bacterium]
MADQQNIAALVRDAIINTAKKADALKVAAKDAAVKTKKKAADAWNDSKPAQAKAKEELRLAKLGMKKLADELSVFSKQVAKGVKDGISEVKKMHGQK